MKAGQLTWAGRALEFTKQKRGLLEDFLRKLVVNNMIEGLKLLCPEFRSRC